MPRGRGPLERREACSCWACRTGRLLRRPFGLGPYERGMLTGFALGVGCALTLFMLVVALVRMAG